MNSDAPEHESAKPPHFRTLAQPMAFDTVLLAQVRLGYGLATSMTRFDAEVLGMSRARRAAGTFASAAALTDVQAFGRKALQYYRDQASVVLDTGLATNLRYSDADVVRLLDASSSHLMSMYVAVAERVRELAHMTGTDHLLEGFQNELLACLVQCEGDIAIVVSGRRAASAGGSPGRVRALMRRAGPWLRRLMRVAARSRS